MNWIAKDATTAAVMEQSLVNIETYMPDVIAEVRIVDMTWENGERVMQVPGREVRRIIAEYADRTYTHVVALYMPGDEGWECNGLVKGRGYIAG